MKDVVIVGAGLAGYRAAQALRKHGYSGRVTVVGDENDPPYDRPPLSKQLLAGTVERESVYFPIDDIDANWRLGSAARALDLQARRVHLEDQSELGFDKLIIATGRSARPWPHPTPSGVHVIRSLADCLAFRKEVICGSSVVIVGAGFIGCEVAATLGEIGGCDVTLVDVSEFPMPVLGPQVGHFAADAHIAHGVDLHMGRGVSEFVSNGARVSAVVLDDGETINADIVLLGLGSSPNTDWLHNSGLQLMAGAVVCDEYLCTTVDRDIYVVGDVAATPRPDDGTPISNEHWTNARETGELAAANLLAEGPSSRRRHSAVPSFWSDQYNLKIKSTGFISTADSFDVVECSPSATQPSLVVEGRRRGELVGAVTVNKNRKFIEYSRALAAEIKV